MVDYEDINSELTTFYISDKSGTVVSIGCLDANSLNVYKTSIDYKYHQCTLNTNAETGGLPMTSLAVHRSHIINRALRRLEFSQKVYVHDEDFQCVMPGNAYLLEPTENAIGPIVS